MGRDHLGAKQTKRFDLDTVAERAILNDSMRSQLAAGTDPTLPEQMGLRGDDGILTDAHVGVDNRGCWIDNRYTRQHVRLTNLPSHLGLGIGQIHPRIDPHDFPLIRDCQRGNRLLLGDSDADHIRQILFALGIRRVNAAERIE